MRADEPLLLHYRPRRRLGWGYRNHLQDPEGLHGPGESDDLEDAADLEDLEDFEDFEHGEDIEHPEGTDVLEPSAVLAPEPPRPPAPRAESSPPGPRRTQSPPRRRSVQAWTVVVPILVAAVLGLGTGLAPASMGAALLGLVVLAGIVLRLEWAALLVVATSVFEDYLANVDPRAVKLLAGLLVLAWVVRRCSGRLHEGPRSPVLQATLAFVVVLLAATVLHNNGSAGLAVVIRYAGFIAVLIVLADVLRASLTPERLARAYVAACAVAAICGLLTFALGADRRVGGPVGDPNDFAFFLLPAVALAIGVRSTGRRRWPWDLGAVLIVLAILGTLSRGALLGLAVMGVVALVTKMVRLRAAAGLAILVAGAVAVVVAALPGMVSVSLEQKGHVANQNVSERLELWGAAARMTLEHPVLGMGPGAFSQDHRDYSPSLPDDVNHPLDVAHNTWLELSSELGVLGLLAFLALLATAVAQAWAPWRRERDTLAAGVVAGLAGIGVAATFVTEQYYLPFWLLFALAVGVSARRGGEEEPCASSR